MLLLIGPMCMFFVPVAWRPVVADDNDRVSGGYGIGLVCSCQVSPVNKEVMSLQ